VTVPALVGWGRQRWGRSVTQPSRAAS
jgi:hypothetical protein